MVKSLDVFGLYKIAFLNNGFVHLTSHAENSQQ